MTNRSALQLLLSSHRAEQSVIGRCLLWNFLLKFNEKLIDYDRTDVMLFLLPVFLALRIDYAEQVNL